MLISAFRCPVSRGWTFKVNGIIRTCPKASLSAAFRRFGIERRQPSCNLNIQKSAENSSLSGRRIFTEQIFGQSRHKAEQILCGFASILTTSERKYARENHGSNYSIHLSIKFECTPSFTEFISRNVNESSIVRNSGIFKGTMEKTVKALLMTLEKPMIFKSK